MSLTEERRNEIRLRKRHFHTTGDPIKAMRLDMALADDVEPDPSLMVENGVKTDIALVGGVNIEIPPKIGKGSSKTAWLEFAAKVTDIDGEVLSRMKRDDIIATLEARGNIPSA
jgi:hypothetical protein